jgi:hypothetical protein
MRSSFRRPARPRSDKSRARSSKTSSRATARSRRVLETYPRGTPPPPGPLPAPHPPRSRVPPGPGHRVRCARGAHGRSPAWSAARVARARCRSIVCTRVRPSWRRNREQRSSGGILRIGVAKRGDPAPQGRGVQPITGRLGRLPRPSGCAMVLGRRLSDALCSRMAFVRVWEDRRPRDPSVDPPE